MGHGGGRVGCGGADLIMKEIDGKAGPVLELLDGLIWHYTTAVGLEGIISSNVFWAGSAEFMNDSNELRTGQQVLVKEFEKLRGGLSPEVCAHVEMIINDEAESGVFDQFVLSACADGDSLTMWRNYGVDTTAYAIGIDPLVKMRPRAIDTRYHHPSPPPGYFDQIEVIEHENGQQQIIDDPDTPWAEELTWRPVKYRKRQHRKIARYLLGRLIEHAAEVQLNGNNQLWGDFLARQELEQLRVVKDSGFADEREWRVVSVVSPSWRYIRYRASRFGLLPYVEVGCPIDDAGSEATANPEPVNPLPIRHVRIGPSPYGEAAARPLRDFLHDRGYASVDVSVSRTPFR